MKEKRIEEIGRIMKNIESIINYELNNVELVFEEQYFTEEESFHIRTIFDRIIRRHTKYGNNKT